MGQSAMTRVNVLALDDEPANTDLLARAFHPDPRFTLTATNTSREACELVSQQQFALLVVDYAIPEMNGLEFLEYARAKQPGAVAIMLTAYPDLEQVSRAQRQGLVRYILTKPWNRTDLFKSVELALLFSELDGILNRLGVKK